MLFFLNMFFSKLGPFVFDNVEILLENILRLETLATVKNLGEKLRLWQRRFNLIRRIFQDNLNSFIGLGCKKNRCGKIKGYFL